MAQVPRQACIIFRVPDNDKRKETFTFPDPTGVRLEHLRGLQGRRLADIVETLVEWSAEAGVGAVIKKCNDQTPERLRRSQFVRAIRALARSMEGAYVYDVVRPLSQRPPRIRRP